MGLTVKASIIRTALPRPLSFYDAFIASCNVTPPATIVQTSFDDSTTIFK
jgi:hypothetical protein